MDSRERLRIFSHSVSGFLGEVPLSEVGNSSMDLKCWSISSYFACCESESGAGGASLTLGSGAGKMCSNLRTPPAFASEEEGVAARSSWDEEAPAWLSEAACGRRWPIMNPEARPKMEERVPVLDARDWVFVRSACCEDMVEERRGGRARERCLKMEQSFGAWCEWATGVTGSRVPDAQL